MLWGMACVCRTSGKMTIFAPCLAAFSANAMCFSKFCSVIPMLELIDAMAICSVRACVRVFMMCEWA